MHFLKGRSFHLGGLHIMDRAVGSNQSQQKLTKSAGLVSCVAGRCEHGIVDQLVNLTRGDS